MTEADIRTRRLQQIPVFALRQEVQTLTSLDGMEALVRQRMRQLLRRKPRSVKVAVQRLTREQLTLLVNACPEIADERIQELFEEYRYGTSPSFSIFLFDTQPGPAKDWEAFRAGFEGALETFNQPYEVGLPRIRRVQLNDLVSLPDRPETHEGTYRFQARLDYVDADENVVSTYQTLYGFFWIDTAKGYVIIQARSSEVLGGLQHAMEQAAGILLTPLVISKYLKNELPFLVPDSFRSGRLYDPDPGTDRFRWLTIADDAAYQKGYNTWEERYPEVRSVRYRETVGEDKETSLTIRCDQAAFGLAGRLKASEFRAWCLDRLGQLIAVLDGMRANLPQHLDTHPLETVLELAKYSPEQKEQILKLVAALLTVKQAPYLSEQAVGGSPLDLAAALGALVAVRIHFERPTAECQEEGEFVCPKCKGETFILARSEAGWQLACAANKRPDWMGVLPLQCQCEEGHPFSIGEDTLAGQMILFPSSELLQTMAKVITRHLPGMSFSPEREGFYVRGPNLVYVRDRQQIATGPGATYITAIQNIGAITGGTATVIDIKRLAGPVVVESSSTTVTPANGAPK